MIQWHYSLFLTNYLYVCVSMCVGGFKHTTANVWTLEDNLQKLILSFHHVNSSLQLDDQQDSLPTEPSGKYKFFTTKVITSNLHARTVEIYRSNTN